MIGSNALKGVPLKNPKGALNELRELSQRFNDRLTLGNLALSKRYTDCRLNLFLKARWGAINFNIIFQRKNQPEFVGDTGVHKHGHASGAGSKQTDVSIGSQEHSWDANLCGDTQVRGCYRHDRIVFVDDVEPVNDPKGVIDTLVSFKPKNESLGFGADAIYFGYSTGFKSFSSLLDGESTVPIWLLTVSPNKITDQIIESAPQIVDGITQESAETDWDAFLDQHAIDILAGLRVRLTNEIVRVGVTESLNRNLKILNVAFGPFNF